jgi:addiction module RelE/StbE family toxin
MVQVRYHDDFERIFKKLDSVIQTKVKKQILKIIENPEAGKPMRFSRKGTREIYISPYRLSYLFIKDENIIVIVDLYHKDKQ